MPHSYRHLIFSARSVRDILDHKKFATRRLVTSIRGSTAWVTNDAIISTQEMLHLPGRAAFCLPHAPIKTGNIIWVKETWAAPGVYDDLPIKDLPANTTQASLAYKATEEFPVYYKWRSALYMPKWASRLFLQVTAYDLQPLGQMSDFDAQLEGATDLAEYKELWNEYNGKRAPFSPELWVWTYHFQPVKPQVDGTVIPLFQEANNEST